MFCRHRYQYTQGYFVCMKCRKRVYRNHNFNRKRIGITVGLVVLGIIALIIFNINNVQAFLTNQIPSLDVVFSPRPLKPEISISELEQKIYIRINQERGSSKLVYDNMIATVARVHSQDMADNNFFGYDSSSGVSVAQRGKNAGYSCGVYGFVGYTELIGLDNRYGHTEDIYSKSTYHWLNEDELANSIVRAWMDSRTSSAGRNAILGFQHHSVGVGVAITSDDKVYVTADFC